MLACNRTVCVGAPARSTLRPVRGFRVTQRKVVCAALNTSTEKPPIAKFADSIGLPTDDGLFGFTPFSEVWCGRLAMMGFVTSIVEEAMTGRGTLGQLGLDTPSSPLLAALCVLFGGATIAGTFATAQKVYSKKMTRREADRYKNFLGLRDQDEAMTASTAQQMKRQGDFTSLGNDMAAINEAKRQGTPADAFLSTNEVEEGDQAAREMKQRDAEAAAARQAAATSSQQDTESLVFAGDEMRYARSVELSNGRWAMVGFLSAVIVEAATGKGIIFQIIMYLKLSGLLGPMSGF